MCSNVWPARPERCTLARGTRRRRALAAVETITILLTDLVGSTRLESRVGPTIAEQLRQEHFGTLREAIEASNGSEVKNTGDGLMVAFPSAAGAVECAVSMQQRMERRNRTADEPLSIRVGISTGDATHEGDDYFGMPSIESARLCNAADGGQILVPELIRMMVGGRDGIVCRPVGALELKGLSEPVPASEVAWEPLEAEPEPSALPLPSALRGVPATGYVGRDGERERIAAWMAAALGGHRQAVLIAGEPGIGKTRLASYAALEAHAAGAVVLWGHCAEDLGAPYSAWIEVLTQYTDLAPDAVLRAHADRHGGELSRLVPSLTQRVPGLPAPRETDPETERYLLFKAVAGLLETASEQAPLAIVLDDLHWADKQTLSLLRQLMEEGAEARLLLIGTFRESDLRRSRPLADVLADLRRSEGVQRLALTGLEQSDVVAILEAAAGHEMDATGVKLAHEIASETDGNPFFVAEILRHLTESGTLSQRADGRWRLARSVRDLGLPQSVREVVGRRVEQLGPEVERILTVAAVVGREFDLDLLLAVVEAGEDALLDAMDAAAEASIVTESAERAGRFVFSHALVNHTLYDGLGATRRARLHRRIAEALEEACGEDPGPRLSELAHHWAAATAPVVPGKALTYARRAAERALAELAPDEAMRWFSRALELSEHNEGALGSEHCGLLIGLGEAQRQAGDADFRQTLLRAADLARELGDADRLVRAAIANSRGFQSTTGFEDEERVANLEAALDLLDPDELPRRAALLALLAQEQMWSGDLPRRRSLSDEAVELARRCGDPRTLAFVLWRRYTTISVPESLAERLANMSEMQALAERLGDTELRFWAAYHATCGAQEAGDLAGIERNLEVAERIAREVGQPVMIWLAMCSRHVRAMLAGRLEEAEAVADEAAQLGSDTGQSDALTFYLTQLHTIRMEDGRIEELLELSAQMMEDNPGIPGLRAVMANTYAGTDRFDEARETIAPVAASGFADVPRDMLWLSSLGSYADVCRLLGDRDAAAALYELLEPWADQVASVMIAVFPCVLHPLGQLASMLGHDDAADAHFAAAAEVHERLRAPIFLARTRLEWGRALLARDAPGDGARARALLEEAAASARRLGAVVTERRAGDLLAATQVAPG